MKRAEVLKVFDRIILESERITENNPLESLKSAALNLWDFYSQIFEACNLQRYYNMERFYSWKNKIIEATDKNVPLACMHELFELTRRIRKII